VNARGEVLMFKEIHLGRVSISLFPTDTQNAIALVDNIPVRVRVHFSYFSRSLSISFSRCLLFVGCFRFDERTIKKKEGNKVKMNAKSQCGWCGTGKNEERILPRASD